MFTKENTFFSSDWHLGHANIIKFCDRPFKDTKEMDRTIIDNINRIIPANGHLFLLGDVAMGSRKDAVELLSEVNCNVYLIKGNHEKIADRLKDKFIWIKNYYRLKIEDEDTKNGKQDIILFHYPIAASHWDKGHHGAWNLYGHVHGTFTNKGKSIDVGVDVHNFEPISYNQVKEIMLTKEIIKDF